MQKFIDDTLPEDGHRPLSAATATASAAAAATAEQLGASKAAGTASTQAPSTGMASGLLTPAVERVLEWHRTRLARTLQ